MSPRATVFAVVLLVLLVPESHTRATSNQEEEPSAARHSSVQDVVLVFKTHFDIGYTDLAANVVHQYRTTMIDQALTVVEASRQLPPEQQFAWTIPGWPMSKILEDWPGQSSQRKARIEQAFREGRFVVHALPFTTHTDTLDLEDLVWGLGYSSRLSRQFGLPLPVDAKMTDVPCHSWAIVTLLKHAGVDFLHLGCNSGSSSPRVPSLFFWEGPDGSRLLTMYSEAGYGTGLEIPANWPFRTWLALIHTGDNHGPPTPEEVHKTLDEAKRKFPGARVRIGRLSDFAEAILREETEIPVVRGDMPDTWIHGPMSDPVGCGLGRKVRPAIAAAHLLDTLLRIWKVEPPDAQAALATARENSLLYGEHTWGGALSWITSLAPGRISFPYGEAFQLDLARGRFQRLEESWKEHTSYIEGAHIQTRGVLETHLHLLAQAVRIPGPRIVVFNPLPWKRDGLVSVVWRHGALPAVRPVDGGPPAPCTVEGQTLRFVARDVPAAGYRTYIPTSEASLPAYHIETQAALLETQYFKATLDPTRGCVRSLIDKRSGRELVESSRQPGFGQHLYERYDADQVRAYVRDYVKIQADWAVNELGKPALPPAAQVPYLAAWPRHTNLRFEERPYEIVAVLHSPAGDGVPYAVTTRLVLYLELPYADLELTIHNKPKDSWPEACWICLPFQVEQPRFRLGRLGSIVDPTRDLVPGSNRDLLWLHTGLTITSPDGRGVGLCPMDHPLVSLERPGCMKYSPDFVASKPWVYVNFFNNHWTTNFRMWNGGTWTSRVRIWAVEEANWATELIRPSAEALAPLLGAAAVGEAGPLPVTQSGLEVSCPGVLLGFFGPNPDGAGILLRFWEASGNPGLCEVQLPEGLNIAEVVPIDLRGRPVGKTIPVQDGKFRFKLGKFAPASFLMVPATTPPKVPAE